MKLTPSQQTIFDLLKDGRPHGKVEIRMLLDEYMEDGTLRVAIHLLRKKLQPQGLDIFQRHSSYQLVRLLHSAYDGKR